MNGRAPALKFHLFSLLAQGNLDVPHRFSLEHTEAGPKNLSHNLKAKTKTPFG